MRLNNVHHLDQWCPTPGCGPVPGQLVPDMDSFRQLFHNNAEYSASGCLILRGFKFFILLRKYVKKYQF